MEGTVFGCLPTGEEVRLYCLTCGQASAQVMPYGAVLVSLRPFGDVDVVCGFDSFDHYLQDEEVLGAVVGRVANRIENARFVLDGREYRLPENDNGNCLHGGSGFHTKLWCVDDVTENSITLSYLSPDGEDGFPADLRVEVTYTLLEHMLVISYRAWPDGKTPIALTNHSYFNLNGVGEDVMTHKVQIWADRYTAVDDLLIPTGERPKVDGTVFDLRKPRALGDAFVNGFSGYDHNMILSPSEYRDILGHRLGLAAKVETDSLSMQVYTDQPGVQFYTGNSLGFGPPFRNGVPQIPFAGLCLEAQTEPNCVRHNQGAYTKGQVYEQTTAYGFVKK